ncbi:hypothetical protein GDO78_015190 [Eleutherodactylus coqui]|uniref:Uncharacterized protein n=1 Tax=Eleutherodactylus coqui TaxID=57060 RepID=A0A8J6B7A4_ELECQ|nr:hypothetical protein GDO78_015190 [Eleutherodactylus coqui]
MLNKVYAYIIVKYKGKRHKSGFLCRYLCPLLCMCTADNEPTPSDSEKNSTKTVMQFLNKMAGNEYVGFSNAT